MSFHLALSLLAWLGAFSGALACVIPTGTLSNNIPDDFQIIVQNPAFPIVHNKIMNFRPNGLDMHLVLRPAGQATYDTLFLENGLLRNEDRTAVIDLEHNENDNTTKMFMTNRQYADALFKPVYGCDPETDALQIRLVLVSRLADPDEGQAREDGGQIGIQQAGFTGVYEFRYSPANNNLLTATWFTVNLVIFRDGITPPVTTTTSASVPASTATIKDYDYVSCWAEPDDGSRTLKTSFSATGMTNEICAVDCAGSTYFGTQYSVECWCGSTLAAGSHAAPEADCSATCSGNSSELCGGGRRLSLYKLFSNSTSPTTTSSSSTLSSTTSVRSSTASSTSSTVTSSTTSSRSSSTLSSTSSRTSSTTVSSSSSTSKSSSSTSTASGTPTSFPSVGAYSYVSCWSEPSDGSRALSAVFQGTTTMTLETCAAICSTYRYFGTEWSSECWCDNELAGGATAATSNCNYACAGNAAESCGGSRYLSLYENLAWTAPENPGTVGDYSFYSCVTDSPTRTLTSSSLYSSAMTLEMCATFCSGYEFFGVEWSIECYCGNTLAAASALVAASDCNMSCGGNSAELCGAGNRLSVYQSTV